MDTTIDTGFKMLATQLELTLDQRSAIAVHQAEIERTLSSVFKTHGTVLGGAYSRNSMIAVKESSVVDMYLLLNANHAKKYSSRDLIDKLRAALTDTYDEIIINNYGDGVVIRHSGYQFNIIPSFHKESKGYVIPGYKRDKWRRGNPNNSSLLIKTADHWHKGGLLTFIRLVKCWNIANGHVFNEYYIELLVKKILTNIKLSSFSKTVRYIFKEATKEIVYTIDDPAEFEIQVQGLLDTERLAEAMVAFHEAYKITLKAEEYEHEGELGLAYKEWESLFPGFFPEPLQMLIQELNDTGVKGVKALKIMRDRVL